MKIEKRVRVEIGQPDSVTVVLAGCGGTGSFLALHLARLAYHARDRHGVEIGLVFVDPDVVEGQNVGRQNFCPAEVGKAKARTLALRYSLAFGLEIGAWVEGIGESNLALDRLGFYLMVGAVDNAAARRDIHDSVTRWQGRWWWLDAGNHRQAGQVVIGNGEREKVEMSMMGFCVGLPLPSVVHPELLIDADGEKGINTDTLSCAELALLDSQSLMVNQTAAGWAANYVYRLVLARDLDISATYFDLRAGSARSVGIVKNTD
jgi:PRTRC genetic system ThiF family protein